MSVIQHSNVILEQLRTWKIELESSTESYQEICAIAKQLAKAASDTMLKMFGIENDSSPQILKLLQTCGDIQKTMQEEMVYNEAETMHAIDELMQLQTYFQSFEPEVNFHVDDV